MGGSRGCGAGGTRGCTAADRTDIAWQPSHPSASLGPVGTLTTPWRPCEAGTLRPAHPHAPNYHPQVGPLIPQRSSPDAEGEPPITIPRSARCMQRPHRILKANSNSLVSLKGGYDLRSAAMICSLSLYTALPMFCGGWDVRNGLVMTRRFGCQQQGRRGWAARSCLC